MSTAGLVTMIIVLGILWGGFLVVLALAVSKEKRKGHVKDREGKR